MRKNSFSFLFVILCLGYLIDYYDLSLFAVARISILKDLHVPDSQIMKISRLMFNAQALGVLVGGLLCGLWGDKIGRVFAVRLGIFIYSTSILMSIFITSVQFFALTRFLAGVGLAGELSVSITLLSELSKKNNRGLISSYVYFFGILGGILTTVIESLFNWKILFLIGSLAGFLLLFLRKSLFESSIFLELKNKTQITKGSLKLLFLRANSLRKVIILTICLFPFTLLVFFVNFAPEFAKGIGVAEKINLPYCLLQFFIGSLVGAILFSFLNKILRSHKKTIFIGYISTLLSIFILCFSSYFPNHFFSHLYLLVGFSTGYFGILIAFLAESFGTNQRSTGTTVISNFGRSSFILMNFFIPFSIQLMKSTFYGSLASASIIIFFSITCLLCTKETYGQKLNYTE